jgi:hypothetical protein
MSDAIVPDTEHRGLVARLPQRVRDFALLARFDRPIGWALREYAKTDAGEVRRYVTKHAERLSGLSRREALKNVGAA